MSRVRGANAGNLTLSRSILVAVALAIFAAPGLPQDALNKVEFSYPRKVIPERGYQIARSSEIATTESVRPVTATLALPQVSSQDDNAGSSSPLATPSSPKARARVGLEAPIPKSLPSVRPAVALGIPTGMQLQSPISGENRLPAPWHPAGQTGSPTDNRPEDPTSLIGNDTLAGRYAIDEIIQRALNKPILPDRPAIKLSVNDILARSLAHSKNIHVLRIQPIADRQLVDTEYGQFDWTAFFENRLNRNNTPVGSQNQFANANQTDIRSDEFEFKGGMRKRTRTGGQFEISDSMRLIDENSGQLNPPDQAVSKMSVVFSQELLRDGGRDVVLSQALTAAYQADQSHGQSIAQISERLQEVLNEYWTLFENRSNYFIQLALTHWAQETLDQLTERRRIDAEENTVEQARALLLEAQADLIDAKVQVQVSQDRLYRLVNDPSLDPDQVEMITTHPPTIGSVMFDPRTELETAIQNRGEIYERLAAISEAALQYHVSLNQLLPKLTVSLESSLNGLEGRRQVFGARANAVNTPPTVGANFNLEFFLSNRTARATNRQTRLNLRRLQFEYEDQIEQLRLDVAQAIRTLNASAGNVNLRAQTLAARRRELDYLRIRRDVVPQQGANVSLLLEQFFQALNRLVASQQSFVGAKANVQRSLADLQRAKGLLIHSSEIPTDVFVPVPSIPRALRRQLLDKGHYVYESKDRVIYPSLQKRWPPPGPTTQTPGVAPRLKIGK